MLPKALKSAPKSNKSPNLVTLITDRVKEVAHLISPNYISVKQQRPYIGDPNLVGLNEDALGFKLLSIGR